MRRVTVTFDDNTQHIYDNVPDTVTPDQITARAQQEFPGKILLNIDGGKQYSTGENAAAFAASVGDTIVNTGAGFLDAAARLAAFPYYLGQEIPGAIAASRAGAVPVPADLNRGQQNIFQRAYTRAAADVGSVGKDMIGTATGVTQVPGYKEAPQRRLGETISEAFAPAFEKAEEFGVPGQAVADTLAVAGPKIAQGAVGTGKFAHSAYRGATGQTAPIKSTLSNVNPYSKPTRAQLGDTFFTPEDLAEFRKNKPSVESAQKLLSRAKPQEEILGQLGPERAARIRKALEATQGQIPIKAPGQNKSVAARAAGELAGERYTKGMFGADFTSALALSVLTGQPMTGGIPVAFRFGSKALEARKLNKAFKELEDLGFTSFNTAEARLIKQAKRSPGSGGPGPGGPGSGGSGSGGPGGPRPQTPGGPAPSVPPGAAPDITASVETPAPAATLPADNVPRAELLRQFAADPELRDYTQPYVKTPETKQTVDAFTSGATKEIIAYGPPGTGKTSIATDSLIKNQDQRQILFNRQNFDDAKRQFASAKDTAPSLLMIIDEADQLTPKQIEWLKSAAQDNTNVQALYTTNQIGKLSDSIKNRIPDQLNVDVKLTPQQKLAYATALSERMQLTKTPDQLLEIANDSKLTNFRQLKSAVLANENYKQAPLFDTPLVADIQKLNISPAAKSTLTDVVNQKSSKNLVIVDRDYFAANPKERANWQRLSQQHDITDPKLVDWLQRGAVDTAAVVKLTDAKDAAQLSSLKSLISASNESSRPYNLIVLDLRSQGDIDPAILDRAVVLKNADLQQPAGPKPVPPSGVSQMLTETSTGKKYWVGEPNKPVDMKTAEQTKLLGELASEPYRVIYLDDLGREITEQRTYNKLGSSYDRYIGEQKVEHKTFDADGQLLHHKQYDLDEPQTYFGTELNDAPALPKDNN